MCIERRPIDFNCDKSTTKDSIEFIIHDNAAIKVEGKNRKTIGFVQQNCMLKKVHNK